MKFTIGRAAFTAQLIDVSRAIPSKATIPILTGIKITATKEGITLIGSGAEISIERFLSVQDDSLGLENEETGRKNERRREGRRKWGKNFKKKGKREREEGWEGRM